MSSYTDRSTPARRRAQRRDRLAVLASVLLIAAWSPARAQSTAALKPAATVQTTADFLALGDQESAARRPAAALAAYEGGLQLDPRHVPLLWRAAREAVDLGEFERQTAVRTALYDKAVGYARRAVAGNPADPEAHFHLSRALGRTALAMGPRERVKLAIDVRSAAIEVLRLQPRHAGALHVLGVWNAEIMRLNGLARAVAKTFMGAKVFDAASWGEATRYLEQAVAIEPNRLVHRLDLARIHRDAGRVGDARTAFQTALRSPLTDANDVQYREAAERELRALK
jgi:tetratricopeptide (TPR) repeat protein